MQTATITLIDGTEIHTAQTLREIMDQIDCHSYRPYVYVYDVDVSKWLVVIVNNILGIE